MKDKIRVFRDGGEKEKTNCRIIKCNPKVEKRY